MIYFVVEGKTDTNKLKNIFPNCETIETNGSEINSKIIFLIKKIATNHEVIIFTDPDGPGKKIRQTIIQEIPNLKHAFIAKEKAIKNNKVGVAEASKEDIINALDNLIDFNSEKLNKIFSWKTFIQKGYVGLSGSKQLRKELCLKIGIPYANAKTLYKWLQMIRYDIER